MLVIRDAKIEDVSQIISINILGWKETYKGIFPKVFLDKLDPNDDSIQKKCQNEIDKYVVALVNGEFVGMAMYGNNKKDYDDSYAEIYALYVKEKFKRQKIGTELVKFIFQKLKNKYKYVLISTLKENNANNFYKKIGGIKIGECEFFIENNKYIENIYKYII